VFLPVFASYKTCQTLRPILEANFSGFLQFFTVYKSIPFAGYPGIKNEPF
jgi:hypothetical protein